MRCAFKNAWHRGRKPFKTLPGFWQQTTKTSVFCSLSKTHSVSKAQTQLTIRVTISYVSTIFICSSADYIIVKYYYSIHLSVTKIRRHMNGLQIYKIPTNQNQSKCKFLNVSPNTIYQMCKSQIVKYESHTQLQMIKHNNLSTQRQRVNAISSC